LSRLTRRPLGLAALFVAALVFSALTMLQGIQPNDEGLMLQAAARISSGQVPYSDFWWFYPPGQPYLLAGFDWLFGPSLLWWRVVRVLVNAFVVVLVYVLARRAAPRGLSLVAAGVACGAMAFPSGPHPFPIALALCLGAFLLVERPALAGVLVGLAGVWRIEFAAYAGLAVLVAYLVRPRALGRRVRAAGAFAGAALLAALALYAPVVLSAGLGDSWDLLVDYPLTDFTDYQSLPFPLDYDGLLNTSSIGGFFSDSSEPILHFYLPLALVIGLVGSLVALALGWSRERWWQVAPAVFALGMTHYLLVRPDIFHTAPLAVTLSVLGAWALAARPRRSEAAADPAGSAAASEEANCGVSHPGVSRPGVNRLSRPRGTAPSLGAAPSAWRRRLGFAGALLAAFALAYAAAEGVDRFAHGLFDDSVALDVPAADGVRVAPSQERALEEVVRYVRRRVPAGAPIYVATRRADIVTSGHPLLYVLTERPNASRYDIAAPGVVTSAPVQREIVSDLERADRPLVVRWVDPLTAAPEPNRAGKSSGVRVLDDFLARDYRQTKRFGDFVVLERRP